MPRQDPFLNRDFTDGGIATGMKHDVFFVKFEATLRNPGDHAILIADFILRLCGGTRRGQLRV